MNTKIGKDSLGHWRKWCSDDFFDIILWFKDEAGTKMDTFQVCLKNNLFPDREVALHWDQQKGFEVLGRGKVDSGEEEPNANLSPIVIPSNIKLDYMDIIQELRARAKRLDLSEMEEFLIESKIAAFAKLALYE